MSNEHIHFVTGRLAEPALRATVTRLADEVGFRWTIQVMPITVAALMTTSWAARHLQVPSEATQVLLPGYCGGDLEPLQSAAGVAVERGPRDLRDLPAWFGRKADRSDYGRYSIEILAEINHAPRLPLEEIRRQARDLADSGADLIDVGCDPGEYWPGVSECVRALREDGHRVSIDSFNVREIEEAVKAGAELVLSVNSSNREAAPDWGCEVVVIPDEIATLGGLDETIETLRAAGVPLRVDPILEPLGMGLFASLLRYHDVRRRYPDLEMLMGIGNLTELTDADSAALNVLLLGICEELQIHSVLTTQVINWARSSVRECDLARRLVHYAVQQRTIPKHIEPQLVMLRDPRTFELSREELDELSRKIKDNNYRIFVAEGQLHLISAGLHLAEQDPFLLFEQLLTKGPNGEPPENLNLSHAFYLGYELAKAVTARALHKQYQQDEALNWGFLTEPERSHRLDLRPRRRS